MTRESTNVYQPRFSSAVHIPSYASKVEAGFPTPTEDFVEGTLDLNEYLIKNPPATFFVRVNGDSMMGAGIHPNDLLIVDRSLKPRHGKIIIAVLNGDLTVKRLKIDKKGQNPGVFLIPENTNYSPIPITPAMDFRVWGVVTTVIHPV